MIKKGDKNGQFYLIATIIIIGLIVGLAVIFNYSTKSNSSEAEEIAKELRIEGEKVMDYDLLHFVTPEFENFAKNYSSYAGEDKKIYFIIVDKDKDIEEAYNYTKGEKNDLKNYLTVGTDIVFNISEDKYTFNLEKGKNFYFILIQERGGEKYVFLG